MSVTSSIGRQQYTLIGSGQTLVVPFVFNTSADFSVTKTPAGGTADVALILNTDYTVTGGGTTPATGTIVMTAGTAGDVITIYRDAPVTQTSVYAPNDKFPAKTTETALDRTIMAVQQGLLLAKRALRLPMSGAESPELSSVSWKNKILGFDGTGRPTPSDPIGAPSLTGPVIECTSYSALRAVSTAGMVSGRQASTIGYSSGPDGGEGIWKYDSASINVDDNGTVLAPNSGVGRWFRCYSGAVNVRWFGAKGDGSTNDTTAIQAAINIGATVVYVPAGTYVVTNLFISTSKTQLIGDGAISWLKQTGSSPGNRSGNPVGTTVVSDPSALLTIAPVGMVYGDSPDPTVASGLGTLSGIVLRDLKLTGRYANAASLPTYAGWNTNLTGQKYDERALGIIASRTLDVTALNITFGNFGGENLYGYNVAMSGSHISGGGEVASLGANGNLSHNVVDGVFTQNGVGARTMIGNRIINMPSHGILLGGSDPLLALIGYVIVGNFVSDCGGYCLFGADDGATTTQKIDHLIANNVFRNPAANGPTVFFDYRAGGMSLVFSGNIVDNYLNGQGVYFAPCKGAAYLSGNTITPKTGSSSGVGVDTAAASGADLKVYCQGNFVYGNVNQNFRTDTVTVDLGNFTGDTVNVGATATQALTIRNLLVKNNVLGVTDSTANATTWAPVADKLGAQTQFTTATLAVTPPLGGQRGKRIILEFFNASGGVGTVTMGVGSGTDLYAGSLTAGQALNNSQRCVVELFYITNTWLEISKVIIG